MAKLSSKTQFRLGSGLILCILCLAVALVAYRVGKEEAEKCVFKETEICIAAVVMSVICRPSSGTVCGATHGPISIPLTCRYTG
jgi:hypothetical protein